MFYSLNDPEASPVAVKSIDSNQWTDEIIELDLAHSDPITMILEINHLSIQSVQLVEG